MPASPLASVRDADHLFNVAEQRFAQEKRELETQISLLQAELDANLSSVVTQASVQSYKKFLDSVGFTTQKFIERLRSKRK